MSLIYITGIAGSGKSEVYKELSARGYLVYGTDENQLAGFYNNKTSERLENPPKNAEERTPKWREQYTWKLPRKTIKDLKAQAIDKTVFLCGVAANEEEYLNLFDKLFALVIDDKTLHRRIVERSSSNFGKTELEFKNIIKWQGETEAYYNKYRYIRINAAKPIKQVVDEILSYL